MKKIDSSCRIAVITVALSLTACVTSPPEQVDNVCDIFREKSGWYEDAKESRARWNVPMSVSMAFMYQESRFVATAKPPRKKLWGVIPGPRPSDSYGYSQAKEGTWEWYEKSTGNYGADRDSFADAIDFIGWYNDQSQRKNKISKSDAYHLYLAYHEGQGGFARRSYKNKQWLKDVATKVSKRSGVYLAQLDKCEAKFKREWFRRLLS